MPRHRLRLFCASALLSCLAPLAGCGSISTAAQLSHARYALEQAEMVNAEDFATYEYVSALSYYEKAREEVGQSDYREALVYAEKAEAFAAAAYERALGNEGRGSEFTPAPSAAPPNTPPPEAPPNTAPATPRTLNAPQ